MPELYSERVAVAQACRTTNTGLGEAIIVEVQVQFATFTASLVLSKDNNTARPAAVAGAAW